MADNIELDAGTGGAVIATDDDGTSHHQYVKVEFGADNTQTKVTSGVGLPVELLAGTAEVGKLAAGTAEIGNIKNSGTFAVQSTLQTGSNAIGKLTANSGVDIGDVDVTSQDGVAAEASALGNGILIQGDDGTDRKNINVDATTGDIQVDITHTVVVDGSAVTQPVSAASLPLPSGAATAASQLADGHNVTVDNVGGVEAVQVTAADLNMTEASAAGILTDTGVIASDTTSIDGKITACDTGAVVVTTLPRSQIGPAEPGTAIDSYTQVAVNLTTGANQVLVSSAPSKQIWVYGFALTCGDADGQSISLQDEDDLALTGVMEFAQYGGISSPPSGNFSMPIFKLATDKDLEIDILGGDVDGWLTYAILSV